MLTRPSLNALMRIWAILLLAVIGLQATQPPAAPLETTHGSAFRAATYEVALSTVRRTEVAAEAQAPSPGLPPVADFTHVPHPLPVRGHSIALRPDSTGPPANDILARPAIPRAPPLT